jgi:ferredoxin
VNTRETGTDAVSWHGRLAVRLAHHGLQLRGAFHPDQEADLKPGVPPMDNGDPVGTVVVVGNAGPALWRHFANAAEAQDGAPHPLDRWTRRVVDSVAAPLGATTIYPFDGPPRPPFLAWARRADRVFPSPLGLLIHVEYGLWHAYRGALLLADHLPLPTRAVMPRPCDTCSDKPCLSACPVGAFDGRAYEVAGCRDHLRQPQGAPCMAGGCLARHACPVGQTWHYAADQAGLHMAAFRDA